jgi:Bacterial low temperature requirement A protein (LtrA)
MNYSWFASAYDNDDWVFRVATMVQMVGVIILSLGIPEMFASIDRGGTLDVGVMVAGYVVMRASMIFLWWLVARHGVGSASSTAWYASAPRGRVLPRRYRHAQYDRHSVERGGAGVRLRPRALKSAQFFCGSATHFIFCSLQGQRPCLDSPWFAPKWA